MAIADMFLKVAGVTGEASDADHKNEIEVVSWSWGMQAPTHARTGETLGPGAVGEIEVVKKTDLASPTLMIYLLTNRLVGQAKLTVRKAGKKPVEYFSIDLKKVRVTSLRIESAGTDLTERVRLGFQVVKVTYTPQDSKGGPGAANQIEYDAEAGGV